MLISAIFRGISVSFGAGIGGRGGCGYRSPPLGGVRSHANAVTQGQTSIGLSGNAGGEFRYHSFPMTLDLYREAWYHCDIPAIR